jgi:predicted nucleic acid-binding protein
MTLIVADTGPLNYLIQIEVVDVLPHLAETVVIPVEVLAELQASAAPDEVKQWAKSPPPWFQVRSRGQILEGPPELSYADLAAISLAKELNALLLIDDRRAREAAAREKIATIGTIGLLEAASAKGLVSLREVLDRLRATNMFLTPELIAGALARDAARRGQPSA